MRHFIIALLLLIHVPGFATYYSQCGQDRFVHKRYFKGHEGGVFVDIGAHNGVSMSNTCFFERELSWTGICVEPIPEVFAQLQKNRNCICVEGCVSDQTGEQEFLRIVGYPEMLSGLIDKYDPRHVDRIRQEVVKYGGSCTSINVKCYLLNDLLEQHGIYHVNFLSVDTEGGEFEILSSIDFSRFQIDVITVENNYNDPRFVPFLTENGFYQVKTVNQDLFFVNKNFRSS